MYLSPWRVPLDLWPDFTFTFARNLVGPEYEYRPGSPPSESTLATPKAGAEAIQPNVAGVALFNPQPRPDRDACYAAASERQLPDAVCLRAAYFSPAREQMNSASVRPQLAARG